MLATTTATTPAEQKAGRVCEVSGIVHVASRIAKELDNLYQGVVDDVELMKEVMLAQILNKPALKTNMSQFSYNTPTNHNSVCDRNPSRENDIWLDSLNVADPLKNQHNSSVLSRLRTAEVILPQIWTRRLGSKIPYEAVWSLDANSVSGIYHPQLEQYGLDFCRDIFGGWSMAEWYSAPFVSPAMPAHNGRRVTQFSIPYEDPAQQPNMVSVVSPIDIHGVWTGMMGIDLTLVSTTALLADLAPTPTSFAFVFDRDGFFITGPQTAIDVIYGAGTAISRTVGISIKASAAADFGSVFPTFLATQQGQSRMIDMIIAGQPHVLVFRRMKSAPWFIAVAAPWAEINGALRYSFEHTALRANVTKPQRQLQSAPLYSHPPSMSVTLRNTGSMNITLSVAVPADASHWLSIQQQGQSQAAAAGVSNITVPVAAGASVSVPLLVSTHSLGFREVTASLSVVVRDDDYKECFHSSADTSVSVTLMVTGNYWAPSPAVQAASLGMAAAVLLLSLISSGCYLKFRAHPTIRASSPLFCQIICLGALLGGLSMLLHSLLPPSPLSCSAILWSRGLSFVTMFGSLFAKTYRISKLFINKKLRKFAITNTDLLRVLGAMVVGEVALLLAHHLLVPLSATTARIPADDLQLMDVVSCGTPPDAVTALGTGATAVMYGANGLLLVWGAMLAVQVRGVKSKFNESKYIGLSIYNLTMMGFVFIPLIYLVPSPDLTALLQALATGLPICGTLLLLLLPKLSAIRNGTAAEETRYGTATGGGTAGGGTVRGAATHSGNHVISVRPGSNQVASVGPSGTTTAAWVGNENPPSRSPVIREANNEVC